MWFGGGAARRVGGGVLYGGMGDDPRAGGRTGGRAAFVTLNRRALSARQHVLKLIGCLNYTRLYIPHVPVAGSPLDLRGVWPVAPAVFLCGSRSTRAASRVAAASRPFAVHLDSTVPGCSGCPPVNTVRVCRVVAHTQRVAPRCSSTHHRLGLGHTVRPRYTGRSAPQHDAARSLRPRAARSQPVVVSGRQHPQGLWSVAEHFGRHEA